MSGFLCLMLLLTWRVLSAGAEASVYLSGDDEDAAAGARAGDGEEDDPLPTAVCSVKHLVQHF